MEIFVPNSAHLLNVENFFRSIDFSDPTTLHITFHPKWVSVHPIVLATVVCLGIDARRRGVQPTADIPQINAMRYFDRMGVFRQLEIETEVAQVEHEPAGRFIPVTQIEDNEALAQFLIEMVPLLHAEPAEAEPIKYVVSELVRNVLEHSYSPVGALVAAQYFRRSNTLAVGVADAGRGMLGTMRVHHPVATAEAAIRLALRPGVSGATSRLGGNEFNAGAGLFFTKAIASSSQNHMALYSGNGFFKLKKSKRPDVVFVDPSDDNATWKSDLPAFGGTAVGINISLTDQAIFSAVLGLIRDSYSLDIRAQKKARYKKPRFVP
ncbi:hypothetical protein BH24ACT5_BH24ACT5_07000 [soil metagenome]